MTTADFIYSRFRTRELALSCGIPAARFPALWAQMQRNRAIAIEQMVRVKLAWIAAQAFAGRALQKQ